MPKPIPEEMRLEIRSYYLGIVKRTSAPTGITRRENACNILQAQFPRYFKGMSTEEVHMILYLPSKQECKDILKGLACPRCGHGNNLIIEPKGANDDGVPQTGYDIYCTTPNSGKVFSRCWYHLGRDKK
jgi:hypothetical protein